MRKEIERQKCLDFVNQHSIIPFFVCERMKVVKKNLNSQEEVDDFQGFDIGLISLIDDSWSKGKCGLKIIQYQGVGVP